MRLQQHKTLQQVQTAEQAALSQELYDLQATMAEKDVYGHVLVGVSQSSYRPWGLGLIHALSASNQSALKNLAHNRTRRD